MYCKNCGKEISNEAFMCPACGEPTDKTNAKKPALEQTAQSGSIPFAAFMLSVVSLFLAPFVCTAFFVCYYNPYVIIFGYIAQILLTVCGFILALYSISHVKHQQGKTKVFTVISVVFTSVVLVLLFVMLCVFIFLR